jgi:predicted RNase H-like nuclease
VALVLPEQRLIEGCTSLAAVLAALPDVRVVAVDMPIDPPERGERECDLAARAALGRFRASLFITPTRAALACPSQAQASHVNRSLGGAGVSAQAFALRGKIREVAQVQTSAKLIEVHPELTFTLLGPTRFPKKSWAGVRERLAVLEAHGLDPLRWASTGWAAADDTLDAAVAALSAQRYAQGLARGFPAQGSGPRIWA